MILNPENESNKATDDVGFTSYQERRRKHWDVIACKMDSWTGWSMAYHERLSQICRFWVAPGQRTLEIGCGRGDLLAALRPSQGVGVDFSPEMVRRAGMLHPELEFIEADAHYLRTITGTFDVIILSDLIDVSGMCKRHLSNSPPYVISERG